MEENKERRRRGLFCIAEPSCFEIASINLAPVYGQEYIKKKKQPPKGTSDLEMQVDLLLTRIQKPRLTRQNCC